MNEDFSKLMNDALKDNNISAFIEGINEEITKQINVMEHLDALLELDHSQISVWSSGRLKAASFIGGLMEAKRQIEQLSQKKG